MNENFPFRLFSRARARTPPRSPRPGTLPGVGLDRKKAARVEETPKCLTTKPEHTCGWTGGNGGGTFTNSCNFLVYSEEEHRVDK